MKLQNEKSRCVCETLQYAPGGDQVQKAISSFKVKVKVTRSLTLVSFEGHHKWSMHAKYEVSISYGSKVIAKVKVDNRQTGQKQYAPDHSIRGHKNTHTLWDPNSNVPIQTDPYHRAIGTCDKAQVLLYMSYTQSTWGHIKQSTMYATYVTVSILIKQQQLQMLPFYSYIVNYRIKNIHFM